MTLTATLVATGVHHIFRLGPELILPTLIGSTLPLVLLSLYDRFQRRWLAYVYSAYAALTVFWFGFLDGFLDHVLKAVGLENTTFLPGSDAEVVATVFSLWSQGATTVFYEGTGVLSAMLAVPAAVSTGIFLVGTLGIGKHQHA